MKMTIESILQSLQWLSFLYVFEFQYAHDSRASHHGINVAEVQNGECVVRCRPNLVMFMAGKH